MKNVKVRKRSSDYTDQHVHLIHTNGEYEVYLLLQGDVTFNIDGKRYPLEINDILLINNSEVHNVEVGPNRPYERIYIYFDDRYFQGFSDKDYDLLYAFRRDAKTGSRNNRIGHQIVYKYELDKKIEKIYEVYNSDAPGAKVLLTSMMLDLLVNINFAYQEYILEDAAEGEKISQNEKIDDVIRYITNNLGAKFTLEDLSKRFFISKYYLCHEFQRVTGMSCLEYIRYKKILEARQQLKNGQSINDVWLNLGFVDYSNFYRTFKKVSGMSPKEFVRQSRPQSGLEKE